MSSPSKKKRISRKKETEPKRVVEERAQKPAGAPPFAVVEARHGRRLMHRQARGYSMGEVAQACLDFGLARKWGLLVDDRRRSVLEGNTASLRKWSPLSKKKTVERVEGEARKIEKAVGKEVRKAEKELEKVEKEIVEKVEAPIKKRSKKKKATKPKTP